MSIDIVMDFREGFEPAAELPQLWQQAAEAALAVAGVDDDMYEVSLVVCGDEEIHELNREYRGVDRPTDVLSFALEEGEDMWVPEGEPLLLGDIVISLPRAAAQAEEFGHSLRREAVFLFVHGMLHLLGYDHMEPEDEQEMMALQNQVMDKLGISR
jgi:probable rRNA maturation factor